LPAGAGNWDNWINCAK